MPVNPVLLHKLDSTLVLRYYECTITDHYRSLIVLTNNNLSSEIHNAWHRLQGSRTFNLTLEGTLPSMYVLTAKIVLCACLIYSVSTGGHLRSIILPEHRLLTGVASNVRHLSDVAFSRIWHVSSIMLFCGQKPVIFTRLSLRWRCPGIRLRDDGSPSKESYLNCLFTWRYQGHRYLKWWSIHGY